MNTLILAYVLLAPDAPVPPVKTKQIQQTTYLMSWGTELWQLELRSNNFYICRKIKEGDGTKAAVPYSTHGQWEWNAKKREFSMAESKGMSVKWIMILDTNLKGKVTSIITDNEKKDDPDGVSVLFRKGKYKDFDD